MENYTLLDAVNALWRDVRIIFRWVFWIVLLVSLVTLIAPKTYTSEGKVFVRLGRENAALDATTTLGERPVVAMPLTRESEINSVTEMMKNRTLYEHIVDELGPEVILRKTPYQSESGPDIAEADEEFQGIDFPGVVIDPLMSLLCSAGIIDDISLRERAVIRLGKDLTIEPLEKSNVIQVEFDSHDPELAQKVVQLLIDQYVETHTSIHRSSDAYGFLEKQTERVLTSLKTRENEFEEFKNEAGLLEIGGNREALIDQIAAIENKKLDNDAFLAGVEQEIEQLGKSLEETPQTIVIESTKGVGQEGVDGMRELFFELELRHSQLVSKYSENHPEVIQIKKQLEQTRSIVDKVESSRAESVRGVNKVFGEIQIELVKKQSEKAGLLKKSMSFAAQLDELGEDLKRFNAAETKFLRLKRQCTIEDAAYRKYANNLEQARIDHQLQSNNMSNISVAQPASLSRKPSKPRKLINLILAFVFGTMMGFANVILRDVRRFAANQE